MCGICFAGCAVHVLLPAKLVVQLHSEVFGGVCVFQGMTMYSIVLMDDIAFVGNSQELTLFWVKFHEPLFLPLL
jgi:hypothetical protein